MYWHIGSNRNAKATVAKTENDNSILLNTHYTFTKE